MIFFLILIVSSRRRDFQSFKYLGDEIFHRSKKIILYASIYRCCYICIFVRTKHIWYTNRLFWKRHKSLRSDSNENWQCLFVLRLFIQRKIKMKSTNKNVPGTTNTSKSPRKLAKLIFLGTLKRKPLNISLDLRTNWLTCATFEINSYFVATKCTMGMTTYIYRHLIEISKCSYFNIGKKKINFLD